MSCWAVLQGAGSFLGTAQFTTQNKAVPLTEPECWDLGPLSWLWSRPGNPTNAAGLVPLQMLFSYSVLENLREFETVLLKENQSMGWVWGFVVIHWESGMAFQCWWNQSRPKNCSKTPQSIKPCLSSVFQKICPGLGCAVEYIQLCRWDFCLRRCVCSQSQWGWLWFVAVSPWALLAHPRAPQKAGAATGPSWAVLCIPVWENKLIYKTGQSKQMKKNKCELNNMTSVQTWKSSLAFP